MTRKKNDKAWGNLPEVDIYADPGIWICMDEGRNSNCHGDEWGKNVAMKYEKLGLSDEDGKPIGFDWGHQRSKSFQGIGNATVQAIGKRIMPTCMQLKNSKLLLPGFLESHEQKGRHPLLLSDESQATLGFVKDMRAKKIFLQDYDDYLDVYRAKGCGLKVVCVSHFPKLVRDFTEENFVPDYRTGNTFRR